MKRVLLLEPSDYLSKVVVQAFKKLSIICDHASSAQQAISLADTTMPDAVILELALPGHNGVEFLYEFRSYVDWNGIPIIFYSQISAEECGLNLQQLRSLGVAKHLYKPTTSLKTLLTTVQDIVA